MLGWEDPLEKGKAIHSSILAWRIPWTVFHGVTNSQTQQSDFHALTHGRDTNKIYNEVKKQKTVILTQGTEKSLELEAIQFSSVQSLSCV